jgi:hypothetical protein
VHSPQQEKVRLFTGEMSMSVLLPCRCMVVLCTWISTRITCRRAAVGCISPCGRSCCRACG